MLGSSFQGAQWPGAHRVPCKEDDSSTPGYLLNRCSRCKELVRRSQLPTARCPKASSDALHPSMKRRAQLWKGWLKAASAAASEACAKAKQERNSRSDSYETCRLRRQSAAPLLSASEVAAKNSCGLPAAVQAEPPKPGQVWWRCSVPGCGFVVKHGDTSMSKKRKDHMIKYHGRESYAPLPKVICRLLLAGSLAPKKLSRTGGSINMPCFASLSGKACTGLT